MPSALRNLSRALFSNAYFLLTVTTLSWGGNAVASRLAVGEISPLALTTGRWAGVVILILLFARGPLIADWPELRRRLPFVLLLGALGFTVFNALMYTAAHSTTAINIGIIQGSIPVFVLIGAFVAYSTPVSWVQAIGVATTVVGVALIAFQGDVARLTSLTLNLGDLLIIGAGILYAGYTVALRRRPPVSGIAMFAVMAFAALVTSLPLVAIEILMGDFLWPSPKGLAVLSFVVLLPSFVAQIFFLRSVDLIGPGRAGVFVNLVPIFASGLSVLILGEQFQVFHGAALALVLGGIWLAERGKKA